jgi:hypothetical protein
MPIIINLTLNHINQGDTMREQKIIAEAFARLLKNDSPEDSPKWLTLKQVAEQVGLHPSWLWRIGVTTECGRMIAGRKRYVVDDVIGYLETPECRERVRAVGQKKKMEELK